MESKNERALIEQLKLMNKNLISLTKAVKSLEAKPPMLEIVTEIMENLPVENIIGDLKDLFAKKIKKDVDKPL